ncbi:MAG: adenine phosphoribosyltransferase [bacterium]
MNLADKIRAIPDFPKEGILFRDITTLLIDPAAFGESINAMYAPFSGEKIDLVVGIESRGFIFGTPIALKAGRGFVPIRKPGKLPAEVEAEEYALEYGTDRIEIHRDAVSKGRRVLLVDDLLATGGTMEAAVRLVEKLGGEVAGISFLVELADLKGRAKLGGYKVNSVVVY